jgi:hypothetical protein
VFFGKKIAKSGELRNQNEPLDVEAWYCDGAPELRELVVIGAADPWVRRRSSSQGGIGSTSWLALALPDFRAVRLDEFLSHQEPS